MGALQLRETLHQYIDTADERKLQAIYTFVEDGIREKHNYIKEEFDEIYKRREDYRNGKEELLTTEQLIRFVNENKLWWPIRLVTLKTAAEDTSETYNYYEKIQVGLGDRFMADLLERYSEICKHPLHYGNIDDQHI